MICDIFNYQNLTQENIRISNRTCAKCKDFARSCLHREINTSHHLYQDPTEVGTRNGHLSAFQKGEASILHKKIEDKNIKSKGD